MEHRSFAKACRFSLESLESREVPAADLPLSHSIDLADGIATTVAAPVHPQRFAVAAGIGQAGIVNVYERGTNALLTTITPYGMDYSGGIRVATGDLTGDGVDDLIISSDRAGGEIKVYDGVGQKLIAEFSAFSATSKGGAFIALGDVTGDGRIDLVAGSGAGNRSLVRVFRGQDVISAGKSSPAVAAAFFAFDANFTGGVRLAVGDTNNDGIGDIIAAPGAGTAPVVRIFTPASAWGDGKGGTFRTSMREISVGDKTDTGGVFVAAGDINGDKRADIVVGRQLGRNQVVSAFDVSSKQPRRILNAYGFMNTEPGGIPVAARDLDGDGRVEVLAGGGQGTSQVRILGTNGGLTRSFMAFTPSYRGGVFVG